MASVDPLEFRNVAGRFATGVAVVTSFGSDGPSGMTANAVASLSLDPPLMVVCFDRSSRTLGAVEHSRRFGVHFLRHDREELAATFASKAPEADKFAGIEWEERSRVPAPAGCVGGVACELVDLLPGGDHLLGVGRVLDVWRSDGEPLVFFGGSYWRLSDREVAPSEVDEALEGPSAGRRE